MTIDWTARPDPLSARAVAAWGEAARALLARTLADADPGRLTGVRAEDVVVLLGPDLPWVDGVVMLGRDPRAPSLLVPTTHAPTLPFELLERALVGRFGPAPLAVLPRLRRVVSLGCARPLEAAYLRAAIGA
jgi:hypothetical protein